MDSKMMEALFREKKEWWDLSKGEEDIFFVEEGSHETLVEVIRAMVKLEGRGLKPGRWDKAEELVREALKKNMYGKMQNGKLGNAKGELISQWAWDKELHHVVESIWQRCQEAMAEEVSPEYVRRIDEGQGLGFISWWNDGEEEQAPYFEEKEYATEEDSFYDRVRCQDEERSWALVAEIFEEMDPDGAGYAVYPNAVRGGSIIDGLLYLTGRNGKEGVIHSDWIVPRARDDLWTFVKASWAHIKEQKEKALLGRCGL